MRSGGTTTGSGSGGTVATGGTAQKGGSAGSAACAAGQERCDCYGNGSCDDGLSCRSGICVASEPGTGGAAGEGGVAETGGTPATGGIAETGGTTGTGGAPPVPSYVIDKFATCDTSLPEVSARYGEWYEFADTGINDQWNVSLPGGLWSDQSCAAWMTGGCGIEGYCTYAGLGLQLAGGSAHDLSSWVGLTVWLESGQDVWLVVKTVDGGYQVLLF